MMTGSRTNRKYNPRHTQQKTVAFQLENTPLDSDYSSGFRTNTFKKFETIDPYRNMDLQ